MRRYRTYQLIGRAPQLLGTHVLLALRRTRRLATRGPLGKVPPLPGGRDTPRVPALRLPPWGTPILDPWTMIVQAQNHDRLGSLHSLYLVTLRAPALTVGDVLLV